MRGGRVQVFHLLGVWLRHPKTEYQSSGSKGETSSSKELLSKEDRIALEGLYHLEKAAELGHAEAQRMVANSLASGILPIP
jgi:TPR repeat protein